MNKTGLEYKTLKILEKNPNLTQREVAAILGLSLGKTHYVIRALINKGWVKLSNFKRSDNKISYLYILTPSGISQKSSLARDFLKTKLLEFEELQKEIEKLEGEID